MMENSRDDAMCGGGSLVPTGRRRRRLAILNRNPV